jgi:predicted permease
MNWPWRREQDLDRELQTDLDLEAAELQDRGLTAEEARFAARRALGNTTWLKEEVRRVWGWNWILSCLQDLRFGSRILVKSPGVTLAVVVSLALDLGATTALFSLLNSLLFKTLPVPEPERLVALQHGVGAETDGSFTYPQFALLREPAANSVDVFAVSGGMNRLQAGGIDRKVETQFVSGDYFRILGIQPALGRLLGPGDDVRGSPSAAVAVISYRLWQSAFQGDPSVAGRKVLVDSVPVLVAGVAPRGFFGVEVGSHPDVILSFAAKPALSPEFKMLDCKGCYWLNVMGRLKPGIASATAQAALNGIWTNVRRDTIPDSLPERYRAAYYADRLELSEGARGHSFLRNRFARPLYILLAMAGVILVISCSNIANLLTARALARQRELAVRLSIGARRGRLVRQLVTESALLAAAGLLGAGAVYWLCLNGLLRFLTYYLDTTPDLRMAAFAAALTLLAVCLFGLTPALRATRWHLSATLAENAQSVAARAGLGRILLCGQLALSMMLLTGAILLARSLYDLRTFPAGFRRDHLLVIDAETTHAGFKDVQQLRYTQSTVTAIRSLPGVRSASASVVVPMSGSSWQRDYTAPGFVPARQSDHYTYVNLVTPDFLRTMGTRLLAGREFNEGDDAAAPKVAVVNESFARRYWGSQDPLGKQTREVDKKEWVTVVGVVQDAKYRDFRKDAPPAVYLPLLQTDSLMGWSPHLEVWTYADPHSLVAPVRRILSREANGVDTNFRTFTELIDFRLLYERLLTALSIAFGGLGILICAIGIYGVAAYSVNRRTSEIGVRMALGATPGSVMRLILGGQAILVCAGLCTGAGGALLLTRFLSAWLFGVSPTDVPTLVLSMICLAAVTLLATLIPARRAAGTEPLLALRHQ